MAISGQSPLEDDCMEEREELMASATGGIPQRRIAHFLKPTVSSIKDLNLKLPLLSPKSKWPLHVEFNGWRDPQRKWNKWVEQMQFKHYTLWKKAGIFEAIMCSKYRVHRNDELVFGVAERWCSETNTFVFPWGEATITLEDVMILGGFSVLGSPVLLHVAENYWVEIENSLKSIHKNFIRMKRNNHLQWLNFFMESGENYEHEAFLSLWLSRFVLPGNEFDQIGEHVFPIAVHLARGTRIALAPAVLASIYRDLSLLKESMAASTKLETESGEGSILALSLWAPLQLIQLWAWERFLTFRPEPNFLIFGDLRAARWHDLKKPDIGNVRPIIDSCGDIFLWRPYTLAVDQWSFPKFYTETEEWVNIGRWPDMELESFTRCLRGCVLVGIDCEEPYQPHRVAMQFGFDQDLPGLIPRSVESLEVAWINYSKPLNIDARLYLPARLFESDLSIEYQKWWRKTVLVPVDSFRGVLRGQRSSRISQKNLTSRQTGVEGMADRSNTPVPRPRASTKQQIKVEGNDSDIPPGFPPKKSHCPVGTIETSTKMQIKKEGNNADVPPGIPPQNNRAIMTRTETSCKLQTKGNDADVPPGFFPKKNHSPVATIETPTKKQIKREGHNADVPPGIPPQNNRAIMMRPETYCNLQMKGNDADLTPGFPPKNNRASMIRPAASTKQQIQTEGNDADVPPGFPPQYNHSLYMRPETSTKQQTKKGVLDLNVPPAFPPKYIHSPVLKPESSNKQQKKVIFDLNVTPGLSPKHNPIPILRREASTRQQNKARVLDLNVPPSFLQEFNSMLGQNRTPTRRGILQLLDDRQRSKNLSANNELKHSTASKIRGVSSSAAAMPMGASGSVQPSIQTAGRTMNIENAVSTAPANENKDRDPIIIVLSP